MEQLESKFNITETIRTVKRTHEEMQKAIFIARHASEPLLTDITLMDELLDEFRAHTGRQELTADDRRMFIFIVQYLYAPRNLIGLKMPKGLRRAIARVLRRNAVSVISDIGRATLLNYQVYTQFRMEINRIFDGMMAWIKEHRDQRTEA